MNIYAILGLPIGPWAITLVCLALGLGLAFLMFVIEWGASALVSPRRRMLLSDPGPGERIEATAGDGARLVGSWYAATEPTDRTLLILHGLGEDRSNLRDRADVFHARGWNVAILDGRGFGESGGESVSFGGRESDDLRRWLDRLNPSRAVAVWGRSMGAAIALRTAHSDPRIAALILEAPYADLHATLASVLRRYRLPADALLSRLILRKAARIARSPLHTPRPIDLAPAITTPTLLLHGSADRLVPPSEATRLAQAFPNAVDVVEVPGAGHADVFSVGGEDLIARVSDFLDTSIPALHAPHPEP